MAYIDYEYYSANYKGTLVEVDQFERFAERASDVVDQVTRYVLKNIEFERLAQFIQDQVKKATAAQIEFYVINGGDAEINAGADFSNFSLGKFQYSKGGRSRNIQADRISPSLWTYLAPTGLLYGGVDVIQS
ncbi:head-tail connector protein [Sutcliffiella halmapala]|uniref:hypothetical protein n=1 Tax=Sutcliffiella halmapala TaxID=79882 RepID=UPI0011177040|nr:hypothetical protein [Sutcliffiella halmapala]